MEHTEPQTTKPQQQNKQKQEQTQPVEEVKIEKQQKSVNVESQNIETNEPTNINQQQSVLEGQQQEVENHAEDDNESNWTDATQSIAPLDEDDIWVVDDDIVEAMEIDSAEEQIEEYQQDDNQQGEQVSEGNSEQEEGKQKPKKKKENQIDFNELQEQFVKGNESNQDWRLGKHEKFCTYIATTKDGKHVFTGGGDDIMLCFRKEQGQWKQFYILKHTETVNKIQISPDDKYVISSTQNEAYCTQISTATSTKFEIEQPSDVVCHKQGGIAIVANQYNISIYNLKGLSFFTSYTLDMPPTIISFCDKGKQIVAACQNKIRIITPKSGQIVKGSGEFHKEQISALTVGNSIIYTGCIEGKVYATSLAKGTVIGQTEPMKGTINLLTLTENNQYLLVAPQGEGVCWVDASKMKNLFHNPKDVSITDIVQVHQPTLYAFSQLSGKIHIIDRRSPMEIIKTYDAGNTVHKLISRGSQLYAACEDGFMRVFNVGK